MGSREGPRERGRHRGRQLVDRMCREWRDLRLAAGASQADVAKAVGLSRERYGRIERGQVVEIGLGRAATITAVLGCELGIKTFPVGAPIRDRAHVALLQRFERQLAPIWGVVRESPMPIAGDGRAWDDLLHGPISIGVEAETRPHDLQAQVRRMQLKERDSGVSRMILLIAATGRNRGLLRELLPVLRVTFPLATREVLDALRRGQDPGANGIVVL
jgi:transcriptional regulator with XRE-family HTH domain